MSQTSSLAAAPPLATRAPAVARRSKRHVRGTLPVLVLFLPPALLLFTVFVILPMGEAAWYSFYNWNGYGLPTQWVGTKNYELIFNNGAFRQALINNGLIILVSIVIQIPLALWIATMVTHRIKGAVMFRLLFFLPYVLADVAAGMIWRFVYDGQFGLVGGLFTSLGMEAPFWLADRQVAFYAVLGVIVWKYFGFHMMLFVAGLQSIDKSVLEAADIDGATGWQKFYRVTLPMLGSTVRLSVFFAVIGSLQLFDMIMPLTGGGPSNSTQTLVTFLYSFGVMRMQVGFGSAVGVVLFVICVVLAFSYKRIFMKND
ncbi:sugar ABC transporter permease [Devosia sp. FJ2-5-3]|jgi:raffinose/stachyose/melibiose transport system permease protein|uniref:carbohydrate ABC transporter permease n=1 Tax=Devosia sp. FJ2-5-3 TaxID=2976680 RepID=UPI0023D83381|nr:sugar ABC transporter permease [Devosia sp. FJ2-5-3]WEJ59372.1 sugar ABC transporter permease [Devosia sp. FJ2-5-3]